MDPELAAAALLIATAAVLPGQVRAQTPAVPAEHPIPKSLHLEHQLTNEYLAKLSQRPGAVGVQAGKLLVLFKAHMAKEEEYILPPLVLLPALARGEVTPDMTWAIPMSDRVKAEQEEIFQATSRWWSRRWRSNSPPTMPATKRSATGCAAPSSTTWATWS